LSPGLAKEMIMNEKKQPILALLGIAKRNHPQEELLRLLDFYRDRCNLQGTVRVLEQKELLYDDGSVVEAVRRANHAGADLIMLVIGTWVYSSVAISGVTESSVPVLLYGLSDQVANGNLGASIQIKYVLEEMRRPFVYLSGPMEDEENFQAVMQCLRAAFVKRYLRNRKIASIGGKCMMMYQTQVNEFSWKEVFGVDFPQYDSVQVFSEMENVEEAEARRVEQAFRARFQEIHWELPTGERIWEDAILSQAKMYLAFRRLRQLYQIDVFANKCLPEMTTSRFGYEYSACCATCMLNEEGIITACENDVPAALSMYILSLLSADKVFFADIARSNRERRHLTFFNCGTGAVSMADPGKDISLWPVPAMISNEAVPDEYYTGHMKGACIRFDLQEDRIVTLLRIGGNDDTLRFHVARAKTIERETKPDEVSSERWPGFSIELKGGVDPFIRNAVGHHYAIVYGDYVAELMYLARLYGVRFVFDE
jgi:L-fucose isomerase-like protein